MSTLFRRILLGGIFRSSQLKGVEGSGSESALQKIRDAVHEAGGAVVGEELLRAICPDVLSVTEQFMCIAEVARKEGWSFAFRQDGAVHFGTYVKSA